MFLGAIFRYRKMILISVFFFYLGCGLTVSLLRIECSAERIQTNDPLFIESANFPKIGVSMEGVEFVALVLSSPKNEQQRDAIRMTWGSFVDNIITDNGERLFRWNHTRSSVRPSPVYIKILFSVGTRGLERRIVETLEMESRRTGDLLLFKDVEDSYERLSHKLVASLRWLHDNAHQLKYIVKCDDDSFVRVDLIVSELDANGYNVDVPQLRKQSEKEVYNGLYWGYFDGRARVFLSGKWKEEDWFLCDNYLPYALGGGYVISKSIIDYVATNADMLHKYKSEDISMGVWTAPLTKINRVHDIRFDTQWKSRGCQDDVLVRHKQTTKDMFAMYLNLVQSKGKHLCKTETLDRKHYLYNWNVLPSMCCS